MRARLGDGVTTWLRDCVTAWRRDRVAVRPTSSSRPLSSLHIPRVVMHCRVAEFHVPSCSLSTTKERVNVTLRAVVGGRWGGGGGVVVGGHQGVVAGC